MAALSLLPSDPSAEFHTSNYWKRFFQERPDAFEWYGSFKQLRRNIEQYVQPTDRVLVVGAGNSDFSSDLYDTGVRKVTNIDYVESVVEAMRERNTGRPEMKWEVMDMRTLSYDDGEFDVVIDKGALDALMSSDEPAIQADARQMLGEIMRVVSPGGRYLCVTLAQPFICRALVSTLSSHGSADAHILVTASGGSSHVPFLYTLTRQGEAAAGKAKVGAGAGAGAGAEIRLWFGDDASPVALARTASVEETLAAVQSAQEGWHARWLVRDMKKVVDGRSETVELWGAAGTHGAGPRYKLTILDGKTAGMSQLVAVFIVPQGKEHEYLFATEDGLRQIAASASCARLVVVTLNSREGHVFGTLEAVQEELSPAVLDFAPEGNTQKIPFMTTSDSLGNRSIVARGLLSGGDAYLVEEHEENDGNLVRRLVFAANTNVIQTEVKLRGRASGAGATDVVESDGFGVEIAEPAAGGGKKGGKKGGKGKGKGGKKGGKGKKKKGGGGGGGGGGGADEAAEEEEEDLAAAAAASGGEEPTDAHLVDYTYLCFDYHKAMLSGLALLGESLDSPEADALVIGLGGGALCMTLAHFFPSLNIDVCELDPNVLKVAESWFGFAQGERLQVQIGDGLLYLDPPPRQYSFIVVDVDAKDTAVGMSCPPEAFVAPAFLGKLKAALRPGGMVLFNVAARSQALYEKACNALRTEFDQGALYTLRPSDDDVNRVVCATPEAMGAAQHDPVELKRCISTWLDRTPMQTHDPLGLLEMASHLVAASGR